LSDWRYWSEGPNLLESGDQERPRTIDRSRDMMEMSQVSPKTLISERNIDPVELDGLA